MNSNRVREKFDKLPPKRKQVLLKVLAEESKQKIAFELCDGSEQAVQQHLRQLYKDFGIQGDRERKLPALIQLFVRRMPELISTRVPGVINNVPHERSTVKPHKESEKIVGASVNKLSSEQGLLNQSQPSHSFPNAKENTSDASFQIGANSFLDYFSKSIEQMGSEHIHVRIGAISHLGTLAKYSQPAEHWEIMKYLAAFVRTNAPQREEEGEEERSLKIPDLRDDIQAVLTIIGRHDIEKDPENHKLDLRNTHIRKANLFGANLQGVDFSKAKLQGAIFREAQLQNVDFSGAKLQGAIFCEANLEGAILHEANLKSVDFSRVNL